MTTPAAIEVLVEQEAGQAEADERLKAILPICSHQQRRLLEAYLNLIAEGQEPTWEAAGQRCGMAKGTVGPQLNRLRKKIRSPM